eukprot:555299-Alexandrium_andersonii.AAC.1
MACQIRDPNYAHALRQLATSSSVLHFSMCAHLMRLAQAFTPVARASSRIANAVLYDRHAHIHALTHFENSRNSAETALYLTHILEMMDDHSASSHYFRARCSKF